MMSVIAEAFSALAHDAKAWFMEIAVEKILARILGPRNEFVLVCAPDVYPFELAQIEAQVRESGAKVLGVHVATRSSDPARLRVMTRNTAAFWTRFRQASGFSRCRVSGCLRMESKRAEKVGVAMGKRIWLLTLALITVVAGSVLLSQTAWMSASEAVPVEMVADTSLDRCWNRDADGVCRVVRWPAWTIAPQAPVE